MKKLSDSTCESFSINKQTNNIHENLIDQLYNFLAASYHLANKEEFHRLIIEPEKEGELTIQYGYDETIAGFSRTWSQSITINKRQITTYTTHIYLNSPKPKYPTIASMGLTQAIKYKLSHPQEELISIFFANNPLAYEHIYQLSDVIYPKPSQPVPDQIITVINALKKKNNWTSNKKHPMIVNSPLVALRSQTPSSYNEHNELNKFYLASNPDYLQGKSLLVYMPLHLANINYSLNQYEQSFESSEWAHQHAKHKLNKNLTPNLLR